MPPEPYAKIDGGCNITTSLLGLVKLMALAVWLFSFAFYTGEAEEDEIVMEKRLRQKSCYATVYSPLALPLGELSPQVTERVLQPFSNDKINLCTHITEIPVYIPVGESQNLQPKRHQELRTFSIISKPLRLVMLRAIQFNDKSGRSAIKVHLVWSLVTLSVLATLGHLSQGERQGVLALYQFGKLEFTARYGSI